MAQPIGELSVAITADDSQLRAGFQRAGQEGQAFAQSIVKSLASIGVAMGALDLVKKGINFNSMAEQAQVSFGVMLKSTTEATKVLSQLKTLSANTPLEFKDVRDASQTLLQFGISGKDVVKTIKMLGDVAGGNADRLKSLSLAFGQMSSTGHLMGQDLLQMINAGFNPLKEISDRTGESMDSLKKKMEAGAISTAMVTESFTKATSEGGQFFGMMDKQSKTLAGSMSNANDAFETFLGSITKSLSGPLKGLLDMATALMNGFTALPEPIQAVAGTFVILATAIGVASIAANKFGITLSASFGPIGLIVAGVLALATGLSTLNKSGEEYVAIGRKNTETLKANYLAIKDVIGPINETNKSNKLSEEQIKRLVDIYPELNSQLQAGVTTYGELEAAIKSATTARAGDSTRVLKDQIASLENDIKKRTKVVNDLVALQNKAFTNLPIESKIKLTGGTNKDLLDFQDDINSLNKLKAMLLETRGIAEGTFLPKSDSGDQKTKTSIGPTDKELKDTNAAIAEFYDDSVRAAENAADIENRITKDSLAQINAALAEEFDATVENEDAKNAKRKEATETALKYEQQLFNGVMAIGQAISNLIGAQTEQRIRSIDEQTQAELEAAGVGEATALQKAQNELEIAKQSGDAVLIKQKQDEVTRQTIIAEGEKKKAQTAYEGAHAQWALAIPLAIAQAAQAIIIGYAQLGPIGGSIAAAVTAAVTGIQLGIMGANEPKPPKFWSSGTVPGTMYSGDRVPVMANSGENVISASDSQSLMQFIKGGMRDGGNSQSINIAPAPIYLDSEVIAEAVFRQMQDGRTRIAT
jgi:tape measure domain-containing protein